MSTTHIQESFERFHAENPHVLARLERMAATWFAAGNDVVGVKFLFEALRWFEGIETTTGDPFKLSNSYTSRYARALLDRHPEWAGRIRTRPLRAA